MIINIFRFLVLLLFAVNLNAQDEYVLPRSPALNPEGNRLAFSWQGDIWIKNLQSGQIERMTVHEAYETQPSWHPLDRKSTRLNSSHVAISYAVFCLKKKKVNPSEAHREPTREAHIAAFGDHWGSNQPTAERWAIWWSTHYAGAGLHTIADGPER